MPYYLSIGELSKLIERKDISPVEVTTTCQGRTSLSRS